MVAGAFRPFVGRERENAELVAQLTAAVAGRGSVSLIFGEPGVGKSRLAEELSRAATDAGAITIWGYCWEAGGAPAYWPWIQILRTLLRGRDAASIAKLLAHRAPYLEQLLPELRGALPDLEPPPSLEPERARFALLDAVTGLLHDVAERTPLVLVLEDLHAADPSTVHLLEFVARQIRSARVVLVGTYREAEAQRSEVGPLLARVARDAVTIPLARLDRGDVRSLVEGATGMAADEPLLEAVSTVTEGNPLFVLEMARLLTGPGGRLEALSHRSIPQTVRAVMRERLATLSASTLEVLEPAAVIGREFEATTLAAVIGRAPPSLAPAFADAVDAAVLVEPLPGRFRFSHILLREVIYRDLDDARRVALHRRTAEVLSGTDRGEKVWSEIAHHFTEAGALDAAVDAAEKAADAAMQQLAFDEASRGYARVLELLDRSAVADQGRRGRLLVARAHAETAAGRIDAGRAACDEALRLARACGDAELFALAALERGSVLVFAHVDAELMALLEEALAGLDPADSPLRARLMARLAAARQPSPEPDVSFRLAREAIAVARRTGDERALLATLRSACSALMDLADPAERLALNREQIALAARLADTVAELQGTTRTVFDLFELGRVAEAGEAIDACGRLADRLSLAFYRARVAVLRAMHATFLGRFDAAEGYRRAAEDEARGAEEPNVQRALLAERLGAVRLRGPFSELPAMCRALEAAFAGSESGLVFARVLAGGELARAGYLAEARERLDERVVRFAIEVSDASLFDALADLCLGLGETSIASKLYDRTLPLAARFVSGGIVAPQWRPPVTRTLAIFATTLGRWDLADAHFEDARSRLRAVGALPYVGWVAYEHADMLRRAGASDDRIREALAEAAAIADSLGLTELGQRSSPPAARPAATPPRADAFRLEREGEYWTLLANGRAVRLKDSKGLRILARLVAEPGRSFHVIELGADGEGIVDAGDAGPVIDAAARRAYRDRLAEIEDALAEAEAWNDPARAERAREERAALEAELARAIGLGGRDRRSSAAVERARVNVQRRLRDVIRRVTAADAEMGRFLEWAVRTGTFCSFRP